jgi:hypothetical protein
LREWKIPFCDAAPALDIEANESAGPQADARTFSFSYPGRASAPLGAHAKSWTQAAAS